VRRILVTVIASLAGLALLAWQVRKVGIGQIGDGLSAVGFGFVGILALSLLRFAARSVAWRALMDDPVPLSRVLAATIAGDAIGNVTPFRLLASEPTKVMFLGDRVGTAHAVSALAAENFFYSLSVAIVIILGAGAMLAVFSVPEEVRWGGWIALAAMAAVVAGALWIVWRKPALASAVAGRVPLPHLQAVIPRIREFEDQTYRVVAGRTGRLAAVALAEAAFHVLSVAEAYLTLRLLTDAASPLGAFVLDTVNRIINVTFMIVPLRLGVDETGSGLAAEAIGLAAATGVTLALVRKGRVLVWAALGLALLARRALVRAEAKGQDAKGTSRAQGTGNLEE
jgi:hypothetical protein